MFTVRIVQEVNPLNEPKLSLLIAVDSGNGVAAPVARVESPDLLARAAGQVIESHRRGADIGEAQRLERLFSVFGLPTSEVSL